ncbi:hypothetical protein Pan97_16010 [Bremerella volcania]|uniref:Uncharacterized protein n=1 Tax=Bremerella volcania TaxID=2527984 RepID=A0A518C5V6_9BACT|nr:hypothetical protein [Bremerella volcania]QDU74591.1 hypothetical protein Pan97_16010 [Bremerella volcania]
MSATTQEAAPAARVRRTRLADDRRTLDDAIADAVRQKLSFLLFFIFEQLGLPRPLIQSLIFLKLDVAGHSTLYVARTGERHFWQQPWPSAALMWATIATMIVGTLVAVYGVFMEPIGWKYAGIIWAYALAWFVFNDFLKVAVYRIMNRSHWLLGGAQSHEQTTT